MMAHIASKELKSLEQHSATILLLHTRNGHF